MARMNKRPPEVMNEAEGTVAIDGATGDATAAPPDTNGHTEAAPAARRQRDPNAPRSVYMVIGQARTDGATVVVHTLATIGRARKYVDANRVLLNMMLAKVGIFRVREVV
jgi:hypothetical protein